ncbi:hypothetical protein BaRGS_00035844 [Batillaria attramentaria]|uniref:CMP/dCMP-type deaminase domain-containing protein n=1 Tax=Batillaria attramentaria TaxID=370345 RepID=A0ABD0JBR6_9CAEN
MMPSELVPVLDDVYCRPVHLVDFYVSSIGDRRHTATLVRVLTTLHPLGQYQHLKRVRAMKNKGVRILLCPAEPQQKAGEAQRDSDNSCAPACTTLTSLLKNTKLPASSLSKPYLVKVPRHPPATRKQYDEASLYWPVTFHEDKEISQLLSGEFFSAEEVQKIKSYLQEAETMATAAAQKGQEPVGIVIVDPERDRTIAKGHDLRQGKNPLHHAVMVGVDLVAKSQGGGMWTLTDSDFYVRPEEQMDSKGDVHRSSSTDVSSGKEKVGPYLCTAYDVYVTQEPCPMCCMALVHSRVGRVFYIKPHVDGGLGSRYKIHVQNGLNHHFSVFQWTGTWRHNNTDPT